jgi:anti-sigma regulatory factor (Ser/Thr protein kinase)
MSPQPAYGPSRLRPLAQERAPDAARVWSYPAKPPSVRDVRNALVDFASAAGASDQTLEAVRLTCSEAAANAVEHAYDADAGMIDVTAELDGERIYIVIADQGRGLNVGSSNRGLGIGFIWMAWFSDGLSLGSSAAGGLEVALSFRLR